MRSEELTRASSRGRRYLWGAAGLVILALIAFAAVRWQGLPVSAPPQAVTQRLEVPSAPAQPAPAPPQRTAEAAQPVAAAPQPIARPQPAAPAKSVVPPPPQVQIEVPSFDIVRVDPNGNAVLAGRAAPGSEVTVYADKQPLGHATADAQGNWVVVPVQPLPPGQRQLTLSAKGTDGTVTRSDGIVAMQVPERKSPPSAAAKAAPVSIAQATKAPAPPVNLAQAPKVAAAPPNVAQPAKAPAPPVPQARSEARSAAPNAPVAVLLPKQGPVQAPPLPPLTGKAEDRLSLDVIEYGTNGDVILQGRSAPGAKIRIYLGNKKIGEATADDKGQWQIVAGDEVPVGRYQMRVQADNHGGQEIAKLTMPFERAKLPQQIPDDLVIVQPGNSLWRIARRSYGHGIRYVRIYHANRNQIRDPRLIYPGQLLQIPGKT